MKFVKLPTKNIYTGEPELQCPYCSRLCVKSEHRVYSETDGSGRAHSLTRYECRYDVLDHTYRFSMPNNSG
jgi:hypothetical protein